MSAEKLLARDALIIRRREWKHNRRRVVFTNGCFDLLHPGHIRLLEQARALGDVLVVGLNSDPGVRRLKGSGRPLVPERERAEVVAALAAVDAVTLFDEPTPRELVAALLPDILVKGGDWGENEIVGREEVEAAGGRVVRIPLLEGYSTSQLVAKIVAPDDQKGATVSAMDAMHLRIFQKQVLFECQCALRSAQLVDAALQASDRETVFWGLQNLLNAAANVSKALWGQKDKVNIALARQPLRQSIGIAEDSPLKDVRMRNHYEHFDERIDRWWKESATHNIADKNLGPANFIPGLTPIEMFRSYDPASGQLEFWGESFDVRGVIEEIRRVLPKLEAEANKPHWGT